MTQRFYIAREMTAGTVAVLREGVLIAHGIVGDPKCLAAVQAPDVDIYMAPDVHDSFAAWQQAEAARKRRMN